MTAEYRINYTIERRLPEEADFTEIGFGSSGTWSDVDAALYSAQSDIENRQWETEPGQPDPNEAVAR
ncbi:hypothetical protein [Micromonospora carbonacea]|uniref:Uncharacterized protein n=1 Tax=Micromonospora carbonacea TaxID=47853 RepID=A0A1C5ACX2_9ACTN|nr:hypothetical protein [Micromonospora carbonacea]SCF42936.1 hypothetical protein GA0070563_112159 [Micromonospora carbonacea]